MADVEALAMAAFVDEDYAKALELFSRAIAAGAAHKDNLLTRRAAW
jgi:hypothetical protein